MNKVTGIGGIFFKSKDPKATGKWYEQHLGMDLDEHNCHVFNWHPHTAPQANAQTVWSPFKESTSYFEPGQQEFMINYRVENLLELLEQLKSAGVEIAGEVQEFDYGKFGWIIDPDGRKIELWEPIEAPTDKPESKSD